LATKSNTSRQSSKKSTDTKSPSRSTKSRTSTKSSAKKDTTTKSTRSTNTSTSSKTGSRSSKKRKSSKQTKLIRYEIELVLLFAFTVLSALSLHSQSMGVAGEFTRNVYLGLFAGTAYIVPYFAAVFIFLGINKNLKAVRNRYMTAFGTAFLAVMLLLTVKSMEIITELLQFNNMTLTSFEGIQMTYKNGIVGQGGGVIGTMVTFVFTELLGVVGTYFVIFVLFVIALVLGTRVSILAIWEKRKVAAEKLASIEVNMPEINMPKIKTKPKQVKDARKQMREIKKSTTMKKPVVDDNAAPKLVEEKLPVRSVVNGQHIEDMESHQVRESLRNKVRDFSAFDSDSQLDDHIIPEKTLPAHAIDEDESAVTNVIGQPVEVSEENTLTAKEEIKVISAIHSDDKSDVPDSTIVPDLKILGDNVDTQVTENTDAVSEDKDAHTAKMPDLSGIPFSTAGGEDDLVDGIRITAMEESEESKDQVLEPGVPIDARSNNVQVPGQVGKTPVTSKSKDPVETPSDEKANPENAGTPDPNANQKLKNSDIDAGTKVAVESSIKKAVVAEYENYKLPPLKILNKVKAPKNEKGNQEVIEKAHKLEETLSYFGVEAKVTQISKGPTITMFELEPKPGTKVSKITNLSDDIALSLAAHQVRIVAPIPGKAAVGVEIPNEDKSMVGLRDVIDTEDFKTAKSKLTFALGKDISGKAVASNLAKMPHMLIAGATGSGKSVCVNALISSILFNAKPDEVKFLMIDPKVVELSTYNGIPHLILPVVTDPKKAAVTLNWAVNEMTRRYQLFADTGVKDSDSFNRKAEKYNELLEEDEKPREKLAKIVVIIDELADLMMVAPDQVEDAICRLAQMARAAGIHLIVATQRPSVDVITGIIKANIPSRIAFSVSSQTDSRTILDMAGAEKLLGQGDMLYYPTGQNKPKRIQGAFISDEEVEELVETIKNQVDGVVYDDEILETTIQAQAMEDADEYLADAIELVVHTGQASASMLQRKFRVGYNRAARLVDSMEERGIIGPSRGSKPREVLLSKEEFEAMNA